MATPRTGNPNGRPTDYKPEYCEQVIKLGMKGKSLEQIAGELGVRYSTLVRWREKHPEFSDAIGDAYRLSQKWWEDKGQEHLIEVKDAPKINAGLYAKIMAARFPHDYRDNYKLEISGSVKHEVINEAFENFCITLDKKVSSIVD